jgi:hypothetical protein
MSPSRGTVRTADALVGEGPLDAWGGQGCGTAARPAVLAGGPSKRCCAARAHHAARTVRAPLHGPPLLTGAACRSAMRAVRAVRLARSRLRPREGGRLGRFELPRFRFFPSAYDRAAAEGKGSRQNSGQYFDETRRKKCDSRLRVSSLFQN